MPQNPPGDAFGSSPDDLKVRASFNLTRFVESYDDSFKSWQEELKVHETLAAELLTGEKEASEIFADAFRLSEAIEAWKAEELEKWNQALEKKWIPHLDRYRRMVSLLLRERNYKGRKVWAQLQDKATFMIMILEDLRKTLPGYPVKPATPPVKASYKPLAELLAKEVLNADECERYEQDFAILNGFLTRDLTHEDTQLVDQIKELLAKMVGGGGEKNPYRRIDQPGYVNLEVFKSVGNVLALTVKKFEAGIEKHAQCGLPPVYVQTLSPSGRKLSHKVCYGPLLKNLAVIEKIIENINHDVKRKIAHSIYFQPLFAGLQEVRAVAEHIFHAEGVSGGRVELANILKLLNLAAENLRDLNLLIAAAEAQESQ